MNRKQGMGLNVGSTMRYGGDGTSVLSVICQYINNGNIRNEMLKYVIAVESGE